MDVLEGLALSARRGDPAEVEQFVKAAYPMVWRLCAALVDRQSADDLAQEAVLKAVRALPGYREESRAATWLLAIARHTCMDELRSRHRRRRRNEQAATVLSSQNDLTGGDPHQELVVADLLRHLDPDRRAAFVLTQMLGLSYQEAGEVCGCPTGTIRSRVARSRTDLITILESDRKAHGDGGQADADVSP